MVGGAAIKDIEKAFSVKLNPYIAGDFKYRAMLDLYNTKQGSVFKYSSFHKM